MSASRAKCSAVGTGLSRREPRQTAKGFTLIEVLVVVAIIALLISILLPSLATARREARKTICMANQRSIGHGYYFYTNAYLGYLPASHEWHCKIRPFLKASLFTKAVSTPPPIASPGGLNFYEVEVFNCPEDVIKNARSMGKQLVAGLRGNPDLAALQLRSERERQLATPLLTREGRTASGLLGHHPESAMAPRGGGHTWGARSDQHAEADQFPQTQRHHSADRRGRQGSGREQRRGAELRKRRPGPLGLRRRLRPADVRTFFMASRRWRSTTRRATLSCSPMST